MAIEGLYEDSENASSPVVRRRTSTRRPLGAISNILLSPSDQKSATKMKLKPELASTVEATPVFSIAPEVSPFTAPDTPVRCPADEKELAKKGASGSRVVFPALALTIGVLAAALAAPYVMKSPSGEQVGAINLAPPSAPAVQHSPIATVTEDLATAFPAFEGPIADSFHNDLANTITQPVEISSDEATGVSHTWTPQEIEPVSNDAPAGPATEDQVKESRNVDDPVDGVTRVVVVQDVDAPQGPALEEEEDEATEPFALEDDDWAPLSVEDIGAEPAAAAAAAGHEVEVDEESNKPWEAGIMSGPLHIPPNQHDDSSLSFAGFARLTEEGELYLFAEADSEFPEGMLSIDGCAKLDSPSNMCFFLNTNSGKFMGCVGDWEEALDWIFSMRQVACMI
jgi:hypothetical protein